MNFRSTIGLGVHFELKAKSKILSPSPVTYGAEPNSEANVIGWGCPSVLPKLNEEVYRLGLMVALATRSEITLVIRLDHKNYCYPDNSKAHQITQLSEPLARNGYVEIEVRGKKKRIDIHEMHIEKDAGRNTHSTNDFSYVDLNRQGIPLLGVVSEPDMENPEEAYAYLEKLRKIAQFTGASDVKMGEGSMRVDTNISIHPAGQKGLGTKVEMRNLNSFKHIRLSLAYEEKRQQEVLLLGGKARLSTRRFDGDSGKTILERVKEGNTDYRYFPEPDIAPYHIKQDRIDEIRTVLPKSAEERHADYINKLGLRPYDADIILQTREASDFFDKVMEAGADPQMTADWMNTQVNGYLNEHHVELKDVKLTPRNLAKMVTLIKDGIISPKVAKKVPAEAVANGTDPRKFIEENGMAQLSDLSVLEPMVKEIIDNNPQSIEDFKDGKDGAVGFLVGQIMKWTHGKANLKIIDQLLNKELQNR